MTHTKSVQDLILLTIRSPQEAAQQVLTYNVPRTELWLAVVALFAVNTILTAISNFLIPVPAPLEMVVSNPLLFFAATAGIFVVTVHALYWTGRMMGGQDDMGDLLTLLIWLQFIRTIAQFIILILLLTIPMLAGFFLIFVGVATFWIFLNFLTVGLQLSSNWRAFAILVLGSFMVVFGLSIFLSLIGVSAIGVPANV